MIFFILLIFYFGLPLLIIWLTTKYKSLNKIGAVVIAYIIGLIVGNSGIIPADYNNFIDFLTQFTVAIAIPLILFSTNLKLWFKVVGKTLLSVLLGLTSVIIIILIGFFIFKSKIPDTWQISGLLVGLYSGGDPNLASLKTALDVSQERFIIVHTSDLFFGALFLIFIMIYGKKVFELFLPKFENVIAKKELSEDIGDTEFRSFKEYFSNKNFLKIITGILLSLLIVGISFFVGRLSENYETSLTILLITTLSILASFIIKIRNLKYTFQTGMYFIIVFSLLVSSRAYFKEIFQINSLYIFMYVIFSVLGSIIIHTLLSKIFKIDADTMIISSIALVYSVPFVPVVASALKNKNIILSGIVVGLFGYVIGNYLGIILSFILQQIPQ